MITVFAALAAQSMAMAEPQAAVASATHCPSFTASNLTETQIAAAQAALTDVCEIYASEEFANAVRAKADAWQAIDPKHDWVAGCRGLFKNRKIRANSKEIVSGLRQRIVDFDLHQRARFRNSKVKAVVNLPTRDLTILASRLDNAASGDLDGRAALVNTLSHELTHLIPKTPTNFSSAYIDKGFSSPFCPGDRLVSYGVQDIVEDIWRSSHTE